MYTLFAKNGYEIKLKILENSSIRQGLNDYSKNMLCLLKPPGGPVDFRATQTIQKFTFQ